MINDLERHLGPAVKAAAYVEYEPSTAAQMIDQATGPAPRIGHSLRSFAVPALASGAVIVVAGGAVAAATLLHSDHRVAPSGPGGSTTSHTRTTTPTCQPVLVAPTTATAIPGSGLKYPSAESASPRDTSAPGLGCTPAPSGAPGTDVPTPSRVVEPPSR